jgi:hypothetical protein
VDVKRIIQVLAVVAVINAGVLAFAADEALSAKVIAYYFHGSFRCMTCTNMEKYSREAVETNFQDALASGKIEFREVNVEEGGNEHFVNDYQLYTKALILSLVKDGKEIKSKNLDQIWRLSGNREKFLEYMTGEINEFMKDAP